MPSPRTATTPYWTTSATSPSFPKYSRLALDIATEVLVVGGGVTGLTTAYLLAKSGRKVVLIERDRCAMHDTGHTSAHLTMVTDSRLSELVKRFGRDHARAVWDAGLAAIETIATLSDTVRELGLDPGFEWVDGYLHAPRPGAADDPATETTEEEAGNLQKEAELARVLGFEAEYLDRVPLYDLPGIRFPGQARIHVRRYLAGVAKAFVALGGRIYEHSAAGEFSDEPRGVKVGERTVRFEELVLATHNPLVGLSGAVGATLFQTKLALYTSYVIAGRAPKGAVPDALWFDTRAAYDFLRLDPQRDFDVVIFGGEDHKTGQEENTVGAYRRLEERLQALCPQIQLTHRWSGQVIETPDGLPYIGKSAEHQYAATGFNGNGLTFGTLAGMMISEAILGRKNPWSELFDPSRKALTRGLWDYLKENADYPYYMIRDRFAGPDAASLRAVRRGQGAIVERGGKKVAAYRDPDGLVTLRSAICTHMGCTVAWNGAERTWDCPCHGSRFEPTGEVISGPAEKPLPPAD
jgi:glycine/D-amino acid oxidase-like deaminating enzyme/nitrite reductase/ring-hydroxylating ferredoxin subunit